MPSTKIQLIIVTSFAILEQFRVILNFVFAGQAGQIQGTVICINSTPTQMIDGTEKPIWSLQTRIWYNEFGYKLNKRCFLPSSNFNTLILSHSISLSKDCIKVPEKKKKVVVLCFHLHKRALSCHSHAVTAKKCTKKHYTHAKFFRC